MPQLRIPAVYMRGGSSKGVFFHARDLPPAGPARDALLLRVIGSPDPYGKQIDGMGGATSSTSKVVATTSSTAALRRRPRDCSQKTAGERMNVSRMPRAMGMRTVLV